MNKSFSYSTYYNFCINPTEENFLFFCKKLPDIHKKHKLKGNVTNIVESLKNKHLNKNGELKVTLRTSPILSATCFPVGYILFSVYDNSFILKYKYKYGYLDNLGFWIVKDFNGIHKWVPFVNKFNIVLNLPLNKKKQISFKIPENEKKYVKKISDLEIDKLLYIGESTGKEISVPKAKYEIYEYKQSLIACLKEKNIYNTELKTLFTFGVDVGKFMFANGEAIKICNTYPFTINGKTKLIKKKDIISAIKLDGDMKDITKINKLKHDILAVSTFNGTGDGTFFAYGNKKNNVYFLMSDEFGLHMLNDILYFLN